MIRSVKYSFVILFFIISKGTIAQKQANNWYFGIESGLTFKNGYPEVLRNSAMGSTEGSSAISEPATGELLFYTNGVNVWNREHKIMKGSFQRLCSTRFYQSTLIVPLPKDPQRYYLFSIPTLPPDMHAECLPLFNGVPNLFYSVIDLARDEGQGELIQQNLLLQSNVTYKFTVIPHSNNVDYWLITHGIKTNVFYCYLITKAGIELIHEIAIGPIHEPDQTSGGYYIFAYMGVIKASPDGKKIAVSTNDNQEGNPFSLFDFDATTGVISNYRNLGLLQSQGGVSFSPDNSKLYVQSLSDSLVFPDGKQGLAYQTPVIVQFDLSKVTPEEITKSGTSIIVGNKGINGDPRSNLSNFVLQLAPDGKIYAPYAEIADPTSSARMLVINNPNAAGFECDVSLVKFNFKNHGIWTGLPNFIEAYFNNIVPQESECPNPLISLYPNPTTGLLHIEMDPCISKPDFKVLDVLGRELFEKENIEPNTFDFDLGNYPPGMYLILIKYQGKNKVFKVLKT